MKHAGSVNSLDSRTSPRFTMFLAVLPSYRSNCIELVREMLGDQIELIVSEAHLDPTVRTGIPKDYYRRAPMARLIFGKILVQFTPSLSPLASQSVILDLNPRSLSAWAVLIARKLMRKRTLVWGHIHPQAGPKSWTSRFRLVMRKLASGTISYTYLDRAKAEADLPGAPVWVAPNALYRQADVRPGTEYGVKRTDVMYVGRFVPAKKLLLLIRAFAIAAAEIPEIRLKLIGGGTDEIAMRNLVKDLKLEDRVIFGGWEDDVSALRKEYGTAFCSVSPGFAGLGLTQSLGFGVPMIVADRENHSPEIELYNSGGVDWFSADVAASLASAIQSRWAKRNSVPNCEVSSYTRLRYSAEAMAAGIIAALHDVTAETIDFTEDRQ